ncbi:lantibiotic dehydratase family protein [Kitasatospora sp. NBC_01266]
MLRVAGLPIEAVQRLRSPRLHQRAEELLTEEQRLSSAGAELSDRLGALVSQFEDDQLRRSVLSLRRQVFNNRLPSGLPAALDLARRLGGPTGEALTDWLTARRRHALATAAVESLYQRELEAGRAELRGLAQQDRIRLGLLLASPTLEGQLNAFVRAAGLMPDKRGRKLERSLLAYLYRTACKTSPFSTFTSLAVGRFAPGAAAEVAVGQEWTGHPRLNVVVLARLAQAIVDNPRRRGDLPIAPASGLALGEGRIRYVRRSTTAGDDSRSVAFDRATDRVFFLRRSGLLERLLELFRQRSDLRCAEVRDWLGEHAGAEPEEAERYLSALLDLGLLQLPALAVDVHDHDPLRSFQAALRALDRRWAEALADRLDGPADWINDYRGAELATRRAILSHLRTELLSLQMELGAESASLPQLLLYEDVTAAPTRADLGRWQRLAAEPLRELSAVFPAYDPMLVQRLTLKGFFVMRHGRGGRCDDLLTLVHDFHEDIFDRYLEYSAALPADSAAGELNWLGLSEITALDLARDDFAAGMRRCWAELPEGADELRIDPEQLRSAAEHLVPVARGFEPQSHFLQLAEREGDPLVVLNNSYGGIGFPFTRFTHCFEQRAEQGEWPQASLADGVSRSLRDWQPDGAVFAEITAGPATTNLNLHSPLTDYQIACPGEVSSAPPASRLPLEDLYVVHDEAADRLVLRSRRLDREVVPLYFGYLVSEALPEIPRTLLLFAPTFRVHLDAWRAVPQGPAVDGVTRRPRVRYRSVVLHRRSWSADCAVLPAREPGEAESHWYLGWQRWRRRHGLPLQVFARFQEQRAKEGEFGGGKPQYVDFASPLSLLALEAAMAGRPGRIVFEEMLPAEDELQTHSPQGRHVAEFAVELVPDRTQQEERA